MASPSTPVTPDTPITIKINHSGVTKKVKLPFRDLVAISFEDKLRNILTIPSTTACHFERYSDSAGRFIVLDHNNTSVYKQLLRAAKAKQKLKLRVVFPESPVTGPSEPEKIAKAVPRPVTIEDVPEASSAEPAGTTKSSTPMIVASSTEDRFANQFPAIPGRFPVAPSATEANWEQDDDAHLHATLQNMARNHELLERNIARLGASVAEMGRKAEFTVPKSPSPASVPEAPAAAVSALGSASSETPQPIPVVKCTPRVYPDVWGFTLQEESSAAGTEADVEVRSTSVCSSACRAGFTVCCNSCERHIPDTHYHCSTCEEGDFDLCQDCIALGITCYNPEHWLIRRNIKDGIIVNSTTERVPPKPKSPEPKPVDSYHLTNPVADSETTVSETEKADEVATEPAIQASDVQFRYKLPERPAHSVSSRAGASTSLKSTFADTFKPVVRFPIRTCNNCIRELSEAEFLHCSVCFDFDLCKECFAKNDHGHHPKHAFMPAVEGTEFDWNVTRRLSAGRGQRHNAVCDGCETFITGVRHKCLTCPDWDYCSDCVLNADFIHPEHRFLPIYEPLSDMTTGRISGGAPAIHVGIYCDGPHCMTNGRNCNPILGDRYKCAVCNNKDFCASCEASPANTHNKTHPLIKFRTPVRHVSVTTMGEHDNGRRMPIMGDRRPKMYCSPVARTPACATENSSLSDIQLNQVQTVLDVKPTVAEPSVPATSVVMPQLVAKSSDETLAEPAAEELGAMFQRDTVSDGTVFPPNHVFEQTWVLRNTGSVAWPAGCCIRFVSGDYMGHVDPNHPAGIQELVSASESTICYEPLAPGAEFPFTVLLRTPSRLGKVISYWRLTTKGGIKFGDRLWCDVDVQPKEEEETSVVKSIPSEKEEEDVTAGEQTEPAERSQMIFPKLEKESPVSSIHEPEALAGPAEFSQTNDHSDFEEWADDDSEAGFLTDEEYDILDASDEEYLEEEQSKSQRK